jgi:hypothetical protein
MYTHAIICGGSQANHFSNRKSRLATPLKNPGMS